MGLISSSLFAPTTHSSHPILESSPDTGQPILRSVHLLTHTTIQSYNHTSSGVFLFTSSAVCSGIIFFDIFPKFLLPPASPAACDAPGALLRSGSRFPVHVRVFPNVYVSLCVCVCGLRDMNGLAGEGGDGLSSGRCCTGDRQSSTRVSDACSTHIRPPMWPKPIIYQYETRTTGQVIRNPRCRADDGTSLRSGQSLFGFSEGLYTLMSRSATGGYLCCRYPLLPRKQIGYH
ncbi:unnamed protein product [Protopolystoma xenopodis]|uniref:Uncharacterized protein n=1 Tax=Protopolystoma xenopodis TaxID=117903 RepID=A0A3S5FG65_9PLAT|nr:unnamed protein product [Protopolystoma xenopodis]